jgi:hypothetical protein
MLFDVPYDAIRHFFTFVDIISLHKTCKYYSKKVKKITH